MSLRKVVSAFFIVALVAGCTSTPAATTAPTAAPATAAPATPAPATPAPATAAPATPAPATAAPATPPPATPAPTPEPSKHPEAVIDGVEEGAEIGLWTFYLSPTFDDYIKATIARFQEAYPGVKVNWEDHQATYLDDYRNAFAAGNAPDVANLSDTEGWVREFASKGLLLSMTDNLPADVIDDYYPGLFNQQLVGGKSYQVPWYQAIAIELINTQVYTGTPQGTDPETYAGGAGLKVEDFPKTFDGIPALCQTIVDTTGKLCDMRLTVNNLLADMVYQGGAKVVADDAKSFTFNSAEGVAWLQMYVDLVAKGLVDKEALITADDRIALDKFIQGEAAFYQTGPQLIREVRSKNPGLYGYLAAVPLPPGKSGATAPTSMAMSVKADTKFPKAALALAVFFTNPKSMLEFSKIVGIYPSTPASYEDEFFSGTPVAIEESVRPIAKDIIASQKDLMPELPSGVASADVNQIILKHVQEALFNNVDAQAALDAAVEEANALIK